MLESENKFKGLVQASIEQAKEVHEIELNEEQISNITDRIFITISNYLKENYVEDKSQ